MQEVRFGFGKNWQRFLTTLNDERIAAAVASLQGFLGGEDLRGRTFIDIGSGSGLHSLAAHRLGASRIVSFDYDADSVACTRQLWQREGSPAHWTVRQGSALDANFLRQLGTFDVAYSWGVLHHTGAMWPAVRTTASTCVAPGGLFVLGLYNRRPGLSKAMTAVKRSYSAGGPVTRGLLLSGYTAATLAYGAARGQLSLRGIRDYGKNRGMSWWHDMVDWVGGYPFECATPAEVRAFVEPLGFEPVREEVHGSFAAVNTFVFRARPA